MFSNIPLVLQCGTKLLLHGGVYSYDRRLQTTKLTCQRRAHCTGLLILIVSSCWLSSLSDPWSKQRHAHTDLLQLSFPKDNLSVLGLLTIIHALPSCSVANCAPSKLKKSQQASAGKSAVLIKLWLIWSAKASPNHSTCGVKKAWALHLHFKNLAAAFECSFYSSSTAHCTMCQMAQPSQISLLRKTTQYGSKQPGSTVAHCQMILILQRPICWIKSLQIAWCLGSVLPCPNCPSDGLYSLQNC